MRLLFFFVFLPCSLFAQKSVLKDPDVVWAARIEHDWVLDVSSLETEWDSGLTTLKILRVEQDWHRDITLAESMPGTTPIIPYRSRILSPPLTGAFLADLVYQAALSGTLPVFRDADCRVPIDITGRGFQDTLVIFDPLTQQEKVKTAYSEIDPVARFTGWRLREILAYHKKSAQWSMTVTAIAPLVYDWGEREVRPMFWFRPTDKRPDLRSKNILWAKTTRNVQAKTRLAIDSVPVIKALPGFQNPLVHQFRVLEKRVKIPFYDSQNAQRLSFAERTSMLTAADTVVIFDPETYEERTVVVRNDLLAENMEELRLLQSWYWDARRNRLSICLDGVAPLIDVLDAYGNFRFSRPLFYRRSRR